MAQAEVVEEAFLHIHIPADWLELLREAEHVVCLHVLDIDERSLERSQACFANDEMRLYHDSQTMIILRGVVIIEI